MGYSFSKNGYEVLPEVQPPEIWRKKPWLSRMIRSRAFPVAVIILILLGIFGRTGVRKIRYITPSLGLSEHLTRSWAQYSPYFPVEVYRKPVGCTITQVNILQRHGARYPTTGAGARIRTAVKKLKDSGTFHESNLKFLETYEYQLGENDLVPFGAAQSFDAGQEAFDRYSHLVSKTSVPFVRSSSASRVVASATNWSAGFIHASGGSISPSAPIILNEAANDTLDDKMCPNSGDSDAQTTVWRDIFGPAITARLHTAAPGAKLSNADIPSLISLCAFDSVAREDASPWCKVFGQEDFANFEYYGDVDKYYNTGYGQSLGPVQGVGYVNELLARLTGSPVNDSTQTNSTLDRSPATFPLDRTLYADFSHDNQMIAIYAAMGIMRPHTALDPTKPDPHRSWRVSQLTPFSGRLVIERLHCDDRGTAVRMLIDDALVPLEFCGAGKDGICSLNEFVRSQAYARYGGGGDWERCFS